MYEYLIYWFRRERSKYFKILLNLFVLEAARKEKVIISMIPERRKGSQQPIVLIQIRKICAIFARQLRRQNFATSIQSTTTREFAVHTFALTKRRFRKIREDKYIIMAEEILSLNPNK